MYLSSLGKSTLNSNWLELNDNKTLFSYTNIVWRDMTSLLFFFCLSHFSPNIWGLFSIYSLLCSCGSVRNMHKRTDRLISYYASSLCETAVRCKRFLSIRMQRELSKSSDPFSLQNPKVTGAVTFGCPWYLRFLLS